MQQPHEPQPHPPRPQRDTTPELERTSAAPSAESREYWRRNKALMWRLGLIWFAVSYGCGILLVDQLNAVQVGGYKLGFWFAQQGSIYVFIALIFYYARAMERLERALGVEEE